MNAPFDQAVRERFATALDRNFSVVAAAGSGKTRALTERIVSLAKSRSARELLPRLVVVTYTNRAANEMQQRTRAEILGAKLDVAVLSAFNRAFFGTIHSFCVKLLEAHGHFLGLPPRLELVSDDEELWNDFVQRQEVIGRGLGAEARAILLRYIDVRKLLPLGRRGGISADAMFTGDACPEVEIDALLRYEPSGTSLENISRTQQNLRAWDRARRAGADFFPLPLRGSRARDFVRLWEEAFGPFRDWLSRAALCVAAELERDYRAYRVGKGTLMYADQVALALQLFENAEAARRVRARDYRVVLDEAQDTAPAQFAVLLESTRPAQARGFWPEEPIDPPQAGHFCMVGDFQQSIYNQQSDLRYYRRVHDALIAAPAGETVEFSVSFRLDERAIDFLNATFSQILNDEDRVGFVKMHARPGVLPGQIVRVDYAAHDFAPRTPVRRKAAWEARQLARWIRSTGLKNLRARTWRDVAVLCPRKLWFGALRQALLAEGLAVEVQSETSIKGESPAYAWLTALLTIMADPGNGYEVAGVLREVFGLSDHELAVFARGQGWRFNLLCETAGSELVSAKLLLLREVHAAIAHQPLFTAVEQVIESVKLRERLRALPAEDFGPPDDELNTLLANAARAEAEGMTLHDFARFLRDDFLTVRDAPAAGGADAIQLITSHKAKGSEWQAVIVPYLMREVDTRAENFPRLISDRATKLQRVLFDQEEITQEMEAEARLEQAKEMERLLYVALTRAKHTLVLCGAPGLYATSKAPQPSRSQIKWLRCEAGGCNEIAFASLNTSAQPDDRTAGRQTRQSARSGLKSVAALPPIARVSSRELPKFIVKVSPSGLAEALAGAEAFAAPEPRIPVPAGAFDNEATRYGHWWHRLLRSLEWHAGPDEWTRAFETALPTVGDRIQAAREWKLFLAHAASAADFRKRFLAEPFLAHAELPFLLKLGDAAALEGVIDLVLFAPDSGRAFVVDWKTDRTDTRRAGALRAKYRAQIAAYRHALRKLTEFRVEAALFSTAIGKLLMYGDSELDDEWARLQAMPANELNTVVTQGVEAEV